MTPQRWERVSEILEAAWDRDPAERGAFLDRACVGDPELRTHVEALLASDESSEAFLGVPLAQVAKIDEAAFVHAIDELPAEGSELAGTRIGRYTIQGLIGKGGMGAVYRAVRVDDFRMQVAIKLLKRGTDTEAALERFRAERQMLAGLQHPNIAHMVDGGATEAGLPYFVMEYVDGRPLLEYAAPLPVRRRLELFRQVCSAVQYAHEKLIVHRDIKPANILVTPEGVPKLLDFGIAKLLDPAADGATAALTMTGMRLMTPGYASPEQVRGEPITAATDVYSLGGVLYELLTGTRALRTEAFAPNELETAICTREPKRPSSVVRNLDPDLDNITLMALRKESQRRYSSAQQLSDDIERYLESRPVRARKDTMRYRSGKFLRRNRAGVAVAVFIGMGLITGVVAVDRQARRAERRFRQVRKLANTVLVDLDHEIETLAGATKARELLVKTSLEYLDSLAAEAGGDPALQLELATAYDRVGDVQGNPQLSNLGQPNAALKSYGKSLAIAERLGSSAAALERVAMSHFKHGLVYNWGLGRASEGEKHLRMSIGIADSIPERTGKPAYLIRAHARGTLGDFQTYRDPAAALEPLGQALKICREWAAAQPTNESKFYLTIAMIRLGAASQENGNLSEAVNLFTSVLLLINQLLEQQPDNATWKRERYIFYERLGWVTGHPQYFNLGDRKQARAWLQKQVQEAEPLLAADPANLRARLDVSEALAELAAVTRESDPIQAGKLYRRSLNLIASVTESTPDDSNAVYSQAFSRVGFAWVLEKLGRQSQALELLDAAVERLQKEAGQHPDDPRLREYFGLALHTRASHRMRAGSYAAAAQDLERSLAIEEALYRENPRKLTRLRDLADCYQAHGDLHAKRSDWKVARQWYRKSLELWERWKEVGTSSVYDRQRGGIVARLAGEAERNALKNSGLR